MRGGVYRVLATAGVVLATLDLAPPSESLTELEERRLLELEETLRTVPKYGDEVLDDDVPVLDPNAPILDPTAPLLDPNAPLLDPNAPLLDPEVEPESGKILPKDSTDDDIAAKQPTPSHPSFTGPLTDWPEVVNEAPLQDTAPAGDDDPILWVRRTTPVDSAESLSVAESTPGEPIVSPSIRQLAARTPTEFIEFSGTNSNKQTSNTSVLTSGFVEHKLPSELLEFDVSEPPTPAVASAPNPNNATATRELTTNAAERALPAPNMELAEGTEHSIWMDPLDVPDVALSTLRRDDRRTIDAVVGVDNLTAVDIARQEFRDANSAATKSARKQMRTSVAAIDDAPDGIGGAEAATQIARLEPDSTQATRNLKPDEAATLVPKVERAPGASTVGAVEVTAAMEFGLSSDLSARTAEHAAPNHTVNNEEDSQSIDPLDLPAAIAEGQGLPIDAEVPAQIALLSPIQKSATGRAREQRSADDPSRPILNPDASSKAKRAPDAASLSAGTQGGTTHNVLESARQLAARNDRMVAAVSPVERMPDRYASAAASSAALPPIVPYGFFDLDRPLSSGQTHILLPARPKLKTTNSYARQRPFGRQLVAPLLEEPIKASAVAALIPSGQTDPRSTTPRYPFWSFE